MKNPLKVRKKGIICHETPSIKGGVYYLKKYNIFRNIYIDIFRNMLYNKDS